MEVEVEVGRRVLVLFGGNENCEDADTHTQSSVLVGIAYSWIKTYQPGQSTKSSSSQIIRDGLMGCLFNE